MDLSEFNDHAPHERAELVWEYGSFLCIRYQGGCSIVLFHIGDFYAEAWFSAEERDIVMVNSFTSFNYIEPYLADIDIPLWYGVIGSRMSL